MIAVDIRREMELRSHMDLIEDIRREMKAYHSFHSRMD